jgi:hypothetical protein
VLPMPLFRFLLSPIPQWTCAYPPPASTLRGMQLIRYYFVSTAWSIYQAPDCFCNNGLTDVAFFSRRKKTVVCNLSENISRMDLSRSHLGSSYAGLSLQAFQIKRMRKMQPQLSGHLRTPPDDRCFFYCFVYDSAPDAYLVCAQNDAVFFLMLKTRNALRKRLTTFAIASLHASAPRGSMPKRIGFCCLERRVSLTRRTSSILLRRGVVLLTLFILTSRAMNLLSMVAVPSPCVFGVRRYVIQAMVGLRGTMSLNSDGFLFQKEPTRHHRLTPTVIVSHRR